MKVVIIVQARMNSQRLPGKVLKPVMGKPLLAYLIERLQRVKKAEQVLVATTINQQDDEIVDFCETNKISVFRGSESDVLERYYEVAKEVHADVVVRVTADCPLIDPDLIDEAIKTFLDKSPEYKYLSNTQVRTYPRGMDIEVFSFEKLEEAYKRAVQKVEREHVTIYIYKNLSRSELGQVQKEDNQSHHRWTVDTQEDFELVKSILEHIVPENPHFTLDDLLLAFKNNPQWFHINSSIHQKVIC
ncbi:MAG: acylneuraminate cytidylyltransferase [Waddliaceae bacterium]|nr:acylneuraminate cytidylyltransferase [Waddliaceae bacterium]